MAHTTRKMNLGNSALAQVTFTSYTAGQGGESFTLAEFGLTGSVQAIRPLQTVDAMNGNECPEKYLKFISGTGKVMLMNPATPSTELPTQVSMNVSVLVMVIGS